jgi:hypothetical protein
LAFERQSGLETRHEGANMDPVDPSRTGEQLTSESYASEYDLIPTGDDPDDATTTAHGHVTTDVPTGYVSDAELLAWLQAKSDGEYGKLRELMDLSEKRSNAIEDLSKLKNALDGAVDDPQAALDQIAAIEAAYAGTELADDVFAVTGPMKEKLEQYQATCEGLAALDRDPDVPDQAKEGLGEKAAEIRAALATEIDRAVAQLDTTIEGLGRDDERAILQIQDLMATVRQATQLTSNIIAGKAQSADGIVANIRA